MPVIITIGRFLIPILFGVGISLIVSKIEDMNRKYEEGKTAEAENILDNIARNRADKLWEIYLEHAGEMSHKTRQAFLKKINELRKRDRS